MTTHPIVAHLKKTAKYRHLCGQTLHRIAAWAQARYPGEKEALKAAKRKLHQIYGAYIDQLDLKSIGSLIDEQCEGDLKKTCTQILSGHASTAERLPILPDLYPALFREIGHPHTLLDLACGLNPFALPWMDLAPETQYSACDIDHRLVDLINRFFQSTGRPPSATCTDILATPKPLEADVVFLFKTLPCLEQQEKGSAQELLEKIQANRIIVSFPTRSLGGKSKGMANHYESFLTQITENTNFNFKKIPYPNEDFYILKA